MKYRVGVFPHQNLIVCLTYTQRVHSRKHTHSKLKYTRSHEMTSCVRLINTRSYLLASQRIKFFLNADAKSQMKPNNYTILLNS